MKMNKSTVDDINIEQIYSKSIYLVENYANYQVMIQKRDTLWVFTKGFPNDTIQTFLKKLKIATDSCSRNVPVFFWGDIDWGGIQIFAFIKLNIFPFREEYAQKLEKLLQLEEDQPRHPLLSQMIYANKRVQQESMI
jgi:hypothetical protein